jgi:N-acetylglucosaminyl-diphospho-decaprenol L-rhamnosyltransferase
MTPGGAPVVSLTVVLHNSERGLADCIRSVRPELDDGFAELTAVDNASPDGSVQVVQREAPDAHILRAAENRGFAAGANLAWRHVRGRYWMLLNPDVTLDRGGLRELVRWMDTHPEVGVASPELKREDGSGPHASGRAAPSPWLMLFEASRLHRLLSARARGRLLRGAYWQGGDQVDAGWVPGTAMIVRRETVDQVGLLDESFFLYGEDIEWCWRMRRQGWSVGVCSSVTARHREASSSVETFGDDETRSRMILGEIAAVQAVRGSRYARRYARMTALGLKLEAIHPGRPADARQAARAAADAWHAAARGGTG